MTTVALHVDEVRDYDGTLFVRLIALLPCDEACDPGSCEVAHARYFGWED